MGGIVPYEYSYYYDDNSTLTRTLEKRLDFSGSVSYESEITFEYNDLLLKKAITKVIYLGQNTIGSDDPVIQEIEYYPVDQYNFIGIEWLSMYMLLSEVESFGTTMWVPKSKNKRLISRIYTKEKGAPTRVTNYTYEYFPDSNMVEVTETFQIEGKDYNMRFKVYFESK